MNRTWLWLEDQPSTMGDFAEAIRKAGISVHSFRTPGELINQLIDWRQREDDWLDHVGFLLDIQLAGQQFITCPKEWGDSEKTVRTQNGYDAGLVFCELLYLR